MTQASENTAGQYATAIMVSKIWGDLIVNVKSFGAKGNWVVSTGKGADDTAAFQDAIDYALSKGKSDIWMPPGSYKYTTLLNTSGITFYGDNVTLHGTTVLNTTSFNDMRTRIENIIAGAGSDTEIVDARLPETGDAFATLKARLDAEHHALVDADSAMKSEYTDAIAALQTAYTVADNARSSRIDNLIVNASGNVAEVVDARMPAAGSPFTTLRNRLNATDAQLADIALNVESFGAVGGVANDTTAIQSAINALSTGNGRIVLPIGGVYRISTLAITKQNITIEGHGATLVMIDKTKNAFSLTAAHGFRLTGVKIITEYTGQTIADYEGAAVYGHGDNMLIDNVDLVGCSIQPIYCDNPTVRDCTIDGGTNTLNNGIIFRACGNWKAINNKIKHVTLDGIKAASLTAARSPSGLLELTSYGAASFNTISDFGDDGIDIYDNGRKTIIVNNTIDGLNGGNIGINIKSEGTVPAVDYQAEYSIVAMNQIHNVTQFMQVGGSNYNIGYNVMTRPAVNAATQRRGVTIGVDGLYPIVKNVNFSNNIIDKADYYGVEVGSFALDIELNSNHISNCGSYAYALGGDGVQVTGGTLVDCLGDRFVNVNPLSSGSGQVTIMGLRIVNRAASTATFGIRVSATNAKVVSIIGCHVQNVTNPFRDDSGVVNQSGNSWQGRLYGTTAQRPTLTTFDRGTPYWDTSLNKPISWNSSAWKDATGTTV